MNKMTKKLSLGRETLKNLAAETLRRAAGGRIRETDTAHCTATMGETCHTTAISDTCPTYWVSCDC